MKNLKTFDYITIDVSKISVIEKHYNEYSGELTSIFLIVDGNRMELYDDVMKEFEKWHNSLGD